MPWCGLTLSFPGSFVALYRILLNAFPLLVPANAPTRLDLRRLMGQSPSPSRVAGPAIGGSPRSDSGPNPSPDKAPALTGNARLSSLAQAHQTWLRKRSARWHSVVAGAVAGGVAISFEGPSRRKVIAQQLFVRQVTLDIHQPIIGAQSRIRGTAGFKVPITLIQRSADFASHMGTSSFSLSREPSFGLAQLLLLS